MVSFCRGCLAKASMRLRLAGPQTLRAAAKAVPIDSKQEQDRLLSVVAVDARRKALRDGDIIVGVIIALVVSFVLSLFHSMGIILFVFAFFLLPWFRANYYALQELHNRQERGVVSDAKMD